MCTNKCLIGPFKQLLTMDGLPEKGPISDQQMKIIPDAGIICENEHIIETGNYKQIEGKAEHTSIICDRIEFEAVGVPGFVDPHTHICYAGSRRIDYTKRIAGISYKEIAETGGGIWDTVIKTRQATFGELLENTRSRASELLQKGITTAEVKSGYCLNPEGELKMLEVINHLNEELRMDLVPTCLAAHIVPREFAGRPQDYLEAVVDELLPIIMDRQLARRVDIFIEAGAFTSSVASKYLDKVGEAGFDITIHGDQFTVGGSQVAVDFGAVSVDHLEASEDREIRILAKSDVIATVLPGASIGLGMPFAPARHLLDRGCALAIGSDWNPGSAPMGDLLIQASLLSVYEKLSVAEILAGITSRAARALKLRDRGIIRAGMKADLLAFPSSDYRDILYHQGMLKPKIVWKNGRKIE